MNRLKTLMLLATLTALLLWVGQAMGGPGGLWFALAIAAAMNFGAYWFADKIVLRMYHAQEVSPVSTPELHEMVRALAVRAGRTGWPADAPAVPHPRGCSERLCDRPQSPEWCRGGDARSSAGAGPERSRRGHRA